jgi:hypothetical protein
MPPLVPGGTTRKKSDVTSRGLLEERIPNSLAQVSAAAHE